MPLSLSNPKAIAERGEEIYNRLYRAEYEQNRRGKFVAIDIDTERSYVADTPEGALIAAQQANPNGQFHLIQVGYAGAFRASYRVIPHGPLARLFR
jgi:hypothetical protein